MLITRRDLITASTTALLAPGLARGAGQAVNITLDPRRKFGSVPADFLGLGYEISSVSIPGLLSSTNRRYVQLMRTLGPAGVMRIGGITADYASFAPKGGPVSTPRGSLVNLANLGELGSILQATGWSLIWCLNLGSGEPDQAAAEAEAVAAAVGENLLAFEIGNEPDLFNKGSFSHRPSSFGYEEYLGEYRRYKAAIRAKLVHAPFAGPDAATATDWVSRLAVDEGNDLKLLTHHYYRECANPSSTLDKLLQPDPKLAPLLERLSGTSRSSKVPYRICETNSFCGGGKEGVSDTFGAALWALDFMWKLAFAGCAGVNLETGVNQLDFVSWYSPIADNIAKAEYYGMLAFAKAGGGEQISAAINAGESNLTAYAVARDATMTVSIINKDASRDAEVTITSPTSFASAKALRLTGPSLASKEGVTFGGAAVSADGEWRPASIERLRRKGRSCALHLPAASAAVVTLS